MSEKSWSIAFDRRADKDMGRLDQTVRRRVASALDMIAEDPYSGALRKLAGRPESRLRVGDWRVLITLDEQMKTIQILRVLPRGRVYDR